MRSDERIRRGDRLTDAVDAKAAEVIAEAFYEGVIAPSFTSEAVSATLSRKKNLRLLELGPLSAYRAGGARLCAACRAGLLVQDWDQPDPPVREGRLATKRAPTRRGMEGAPIRLDGRPPREVERDRLRDGQAHARASAPDR